ncbi:hypothetical protein [Microcystis aeruginosa]|uniref:DUF2281 domain-containing protein n=1 Tax=Microcystis aeruginosa PCC 9808 TaxID=1160284 RepID=I4HFW1_MICAE|nr:hypothetical protein [Microcystis aeruginosa]CCI20935.1 conserved hypothetical protein [Microcystis aeruginosa PCC 9808]
MTTRDTAIAKLHQLSEPLLQEVSDFIDCIIHKHQAKPDASQAAEKIVERWSQWFETVDHLDVTPLQPVSNYQQLLLKKYRQQGLEL